MKKVIFRLCLLFVPGQLLAQYNVPNTNIYYAGGFIGIGTTTPHAALDVNGAVYANGANAESHFSNGTFSDPSPGVGYGIKIGSGGIAANGNAVFPNGNMGLGALTPTYRLDLVAGRANDGMRLMYNNTGYVLLQPNSFGPSSYNGITMNGDAGLVYGNYNTSTPATSFGFVIAPWSPATTGIRLDQNGYVGICTNNTQGYQLAVNGSAIFTKVVVKPYANWPDYVFRQGYALIPLDSVAGYIKENSRLPEMPSADSVAKHGLDLGGNQALLLKKIEELTLYVIGQQKLMKELKEQNMEMKELNKRLEARVDQLSNTVAEKKRG